MYFRLLSGIQIIPQKLPKIMKKLFASLALLLGLTTYSFAGNSSVVHSSTAAAQQTAEPRVVYASSQAEATALLQKFENAGKPAAIADICIDIYDLTDVIIIVIYEC